MARKMMPVQELTYSCHRCGIVTEDPKGFYRSNSLVYGINGYMPICKDCLALLYDRYLRMYESIYLAIKRICMIYDMYYSDKIVDACYKNNASPSISNYMQKLNTMAQYKSKTFEDTLREGFFFDMEEPSTMQSNKEVEPVSTIPESVKARWGVGFSDEDYKILEEHYRYLKKSNPDCDNNQEIFIMDLCQTMMQQVTAIKNGRTDDYIKLTESYRKTFVQAGLKTVRESTNDEEFSIGVNAQTIEQYTPAEYYKNQKRHKDADGLGDYISRFFTRPLKNLMFSTSDRDSEYYVKDEEDLTDDE